MSAPPPDFFCLQAFHRQGSLTKTFLLVPKRVGGPMFSGSRAHRVDIQPSQCVLYCLLLSSAFVLSLYGLVPTSVRRLPRDHTSHVKYRIGVVVGVALGSVCAYPFLFGVDDGSTTEGGRPFRHFLGLEWKPWQDAKLVVHVLMLYLGSIVDNVLFIIRRGGGLGFWAKSTVESMKYVFQDENSRWIWMRNLLFAPAAEEVVFRVCMVTPLLASGISPTKVAWVTPLFFGVAHLHHFWESFRHLPSDQRTASNIRRLVILLVFQFTYTTLFGAYASHVFMRTGSLCGVILAHCACNYMGLPDPSFVRYRGIDKWIVGVSYLIGILMFIRAFDSSIFPARSLIPELLGM